MKLHQAPKITTDQMPTFGASALPKTVELATTLQTIIEPKLDAATSELPFDDRVLAWLAPNLRRDIVLFHGGKGKPLAGIFPASSIGHLDNEFADILKARLYPEFSTSELR